MKRILPVALAIGLLATLTPTAAAAPRVIDLTMHAEDGMFFFADGNGTRNPDLNVSVGDEVIVNVRQVSGVHNFHVGAPIDEATGYSKEEALRFTVPEDAPALIAYWCDPHKGSMTGVLNVAGGAPVDPDSVKVTTPGAGPALALVALASVAVALAAARRDVP